jgi:hypothetical protein
MVMVAGHITVDPAQRESYLAGWESLAAVKAFRRSAPRGKRGAAMLSASVAEYEVADVRPLDRNGKA